MFKLAFLQFFVNQSLEGCVENNSVCITHAEQLQNIYFLN